MSSILSINTNVSSLNTQRRLGNNTKALASSFERLSSGLRINKASDDAAGLAIASGLNTDKTVYGQGIRNLNDAISMTAIAEGAVRSLGTIVIRIKELAEQAANGTLVSKQRSAINQEANALAQEYNRIVPTTAFNGLSLIDGTLSNLTIQAGYGTAGSLAVSIGQQLLRNVGDGTFAAGTTFTSGTTPSDVISVDLNADGKLDLVTPDFGSGSLSLFLGNGDGTFAARRSYVTGAGPSSVLSGDFNEDGIVDLLTIDAGAGVASVFIGNGNGTFKARLSFVTPTGVASASSDLNGDGNVDLAVVSTGNVNILNGNGDGTFSLGLSFAVAGIPVSVVTGDFNGDGRIDLATADSTNNTTTIHLSNGNGTFRNGLIYSTGTRTAKIAIGDFNNDGRLDLTTANRTSGNISVLTGNGDGSFSVVTNVITGTNPEDVSVADFNGDGNADLISSDNGSNTVSVFLGNGDGSFAARVSFATGNGATDAVAGDFNGDGRPDIVVANQSAASLSVLLANGGSSSLLPVLNLYTQSGALTVLDSMTSALNRITAELGSIGAVQSRLSIDVSNLRQTTENYSASASQILDVDVAEESSRMTNNKILQQAAASILAQANQQPALAIQLLRS